MTINEKMASAVGFEKFFTFEGQDGQRYLLSSLPKQMMKSDSRYVSQEVQTDSVLSRRMLTTKSELADLKDELLEKYRVKG